MNITDAIPVPAAWSPAPLKLDLSGNTVHVWRASLSLETDVLRDLEATLSIQEKSRAARFIIPRDRERFIAARGILRVLLGRYLGLPPVALEFDYGPRGKPELHVADSHTPVRFNLSHSHDLALYAFAEKRELGIDLELTRPDFGGEEVAKRFFSKQELTELRALPPELQAQGFFICWTRKEAYVKALGGGLQISLGSFDVSLTSGALEQFHSVGNVLWSLLSFQPAVQFVAAIMGEGKGWRLRYLDWTP